MTSSKPSSQYNQDFVGTPSTEEQALSSRNTVAHERLQAQIDQLNNRSSLLTGLMTGATIILLGLLGWSIYQSIQQAEIAERQATIMAVTSDSVDLARLESLDSNLQKLEQRLPEGTATLLQQNQSELDKLRTQIAQVQATAQTAENQSTGSADSQTVAALSEQIKELNQSISTLQSKVEAQATQITQMQSTPSAQPVPSENEAAESTTP